MPNKKALFNTKFSNKFSFLVLENLCAKKSYSAAPLFSCWDFCVVQDVVTFAVNFQQRMSKLGVIKSIR